MKILKFELSLFIILLLALLAPISRLIKYNSEYFTLSGVEYFISAVIIAAVIYSFTLIIRFFLSKGILLNVARMLLIISVISVFVMPINLGAIDGGDELAFLIRSESFILFATVLVLFSLYELTLKGRFDKQVKVLSSFSAVYVLVFFGYAAFGLGNIFGLTGVDGDYKLPLSSKKNVFVISFDQIQGTSFKGLLEEDESIRKVFKDFAFYSDTASTYPNTNYSLASVLLGRRAENAAETYSSTIASDVGFLAEADRAGVKVYTSRYGANQKYTCLTCSSLNKRFNVQKSYELLRHAINLAFGMDIGDVASYFPASSKRAFLGDTSIHAWKHDMDDFEILVNNSYIDSSQSSVYFMHFLATHQPFTYDASCQVMPDAVIDTYQNPQGAVLQMQCLAKQVNTFIGTLKRHDAYQDSLIILYSDHGYEKNINNYSQNSMHSTYFTESSGYVGLEGNIKPVGAYNPILFIKYPDQQNEQLEFSSIPASLIDIAPTVCAVLKCAKDNWQGFDLATASIESRVREFWLYLGGSDMRDADGAHKLHDGLDKYWETRKFSGSIFPDMAYAMGMDEQYLHPLLDTNEAIAFGLSGQSDNYTAGGWSDKELEHRWAIGSLASVRFFLPNLSESQLLMRLHANAFLPANKKSQAVNVLINDSHLTTWQMSELDWYEVVIPQGLIDETGEVRVQFEIKDPTAPCDVSDSKDCRKLAFAARELVITNFKNGSLPEQKYESIASPSSETALPIKLGQVVDFSSNGMSQRYVMPGWSAQEGSHRWTEGGMARLQLPVEKAENIALRLKLFANGFSPKEQGYQLVKVVINGQQVAEWQVGELAWHEALIPADVARTTGEPLQVDFLIDEPTAPCEMSDSQDCRKLGLAVRELVIERQ